MIYLAIICTLTTFAMITKEILKETVNVESEIENIINRVSTVTGIPIEEIKGKKRKREIVVARQFVLYMVKERFSDMTWQDVGNVVGVHHTTAIHSYREVVDKMKVKDKRINFLIENV